MTARAKIFADFFHNFVDMKRSIGFLPENKRQDLQQLVDLIRTHIKDVGMVILFGSYAKNKYVDYDQRIEFGTPTYYMSDYDLRVRDAQADRRGGVFVVREDQGPLF